MEEKLLVAVQKVAADPASLSEYLNKKAEDQNIVVQDHKSENSTPSSGSSPGMEQKKKGYGKGADNPGTDDEVGGGQETGKVSNKADGTTVTTEASGLPDVSIGDKQHSKSAALKASLNKIAIKGRLKALAGIE